MKKAFSIFAIIFYLIIFSIFWASPVNSQGEYYTPLESIGEGVTSGQATSFNNYLVTVFRMAIIGAATLTVLVLVIGGVLYISAGGNPSKKESAKDMMTQSVLGLLLILVSYIILQQINPDLVTKGLVIPRLNGVISNLNYFMNVGR